MHLLHVLIFRLLGTDSKERVVRPSIAETCASMPAKKPKFKPKPSASSLLSNIYEVQKSYESSIEFE